ncbi:MAG: FkbM family methyltransferase [Acidimicrobiales bacterium]
MIERTASGVPITVIDVGARWGIAERWAQLAPDVRILGFDPDEEECERLNAAAVAAGDRTVTYVPVALGASRGTAILHTTREPACSSLYPPIGALTEAVPELAGAIATGAIEVPIVTLDEWCAEHHVEIVDVLKLDTQGSELGVLQGAERTLASVQLLEIEVEFNPIYEGQPLFGDVDRFLRDRGFLLWRLDNLVHYSVGDEVGAVAMRSTAHFDSVPYESGGRGGQLYWAHAYFARAELCPGAPDRPAREPALRAEAVASVLGLHDLAHSARLRRD